LTFLVHHLFLNSFNIFGAVVVYTPYPLFLLNFFLVHLFPSNRAGTGLVGGQIWSFDRHLFFVSGVVYGDGIRVISPLSLSLQVSGGVRSVFWRRVERGVGVGLDS